jgi:hypothetical protein
MEKMVSDVVLSVLPALPRPQVRIDMAGRCFCCLAVLCLSFAREIGALVLLGEI